MNTDKNIEGLENPDGGSVSGEVTPEETAAYLRDLTEDDVYSRLQRVQEFPDHINGLESRFNGNFCTDAGEVNGIRKIPWVKDCL